jgi:hypothetical protein
VYTGTVRVLTCSFIFSKIDASYETLIAFFRLLLQVGCRSDSEEEEVPGGCHVQLQGKLLLGSKRKAVATRAESPAAGAEIQDEKGHGIGMHEITLLL